MKKILVIQNKRIGDVLISSVIANNLKKIFPNSHISYFVYDYAAGVLESNPNIDDIITVKDRELKKITNLLRVVWQVRKAHYDLIFDPYAKFQSRMMCLFSGAKYRIGLKKEHKQLRLPFYSHPISFLQKRSLKCGKAIEDRIHMIRNVFDLDHFDDQPKIFLTPEERQYPKIDHLEQAVIMVGVLGSTPQKSMPYHYMVDLIDHITERYRAILLFNYTPSQKAEVLKIYERCKNKELIHLDIYEDTIRGFSKLLNQCQLLIANEGGSVHIGKALQCPTFTIYSPYVDKEHWCSFEDGITHQSIHLKEEKPELFDRYTLQERRKIEKNPKALYEALTPAMILTKLDPFLKHHLKTTMSS